MIASLISLARSIRFSVANRPPPLASPIRSGTRPGPISGHSRFSAAELRTAAQQRSEKSATTNAMRLRCRLQKAALGERGFASFGRRKRPNIPWEPPIMSLVISIAPSVVGSWCASIRRPQRTLLGQRLEVPNRSAGRERGRGRDDRIGVDAIMAIEIRDRAGLPEMLYAQRAHAMAVHAAEPTKRRGMAVDDRHDPAVRRYVRQQLLDMRAG